MDAMDSQPSRGWYISNIAVLLVGMAAIAAVWPLYPPLEAGAVIMFVLLGVVANLSLIPTSSSIIIVLADAVFLATSLVLGPPAGALVIVTSVTAGALTQPPAAFFARRWQRLTNLLRNYGMYMVMIVAAMWVYNWLGGQFPIETLSLANYVAVAGFIATYQIVNRLILYHGVWARGLPLAPLLKSEQQDLPLEILTLHLGILIALAYVHNGSGSLVIFGAFIFFVSFLMRRYVQQLQQRVAQLGALNEIGRTISAMVDIPSLVEAIYRESGKVVDTTNFYIALYNAAKDEVTFALDVKRGQAAGTLLVRAAGVGLTGHIIRTCAPLLLPDNVAERTRALGIQAVGETAQCWLGVPMIASDKVVGVIAAQSYITPRAFTQEHVDVLMTLASQAAIAIENARLLEEVAEKERLRQELALARTIQQNLLPAPPTIPGLFIASRCLPAQETGGDLFDFIPIDECHWGIAIGDVVGKGMPAALLMATVRSVLRAYAQHQLDPAGVLQAVNRVMFQDTHGKTFVTLCYVVLDTRNWAFTYASAGHLNPLLCDERSDASYLDDPGCLPLGAGAEVRCAEQAHTLQPGQALLLYTDGVVEAHNPQRQMLGFESLRGIVSRQPAERLIDTVLERVEQFAGPVAQEDDITLVLLKRTE